MFTFPVLIVVSYQLSYHLSLSVTDFNLSTYLSRLVIMCGIPYISDSFIHLIYIWKQDKPERIRILCDYKLTPRVTT